MEKTTSELDELKKQAPPASKLLLMPHRQTKVVHLIRHGEGFHNVAGHIQHSNYQDEQWFDAHLTPKGWAQAEACGAHVRKQGIVVDVVVVSPLSRALETAVGVFGVPSTGESTASSGQPPLMLAQTEVAGLRPGRPEVSSIGLPRFVSMELCREQLGRNPCDRRRNVSHYKQQFPFVDFSLLETDEDVLWKKEDRETHAELAARGLRFLEWLSRRPEKTIAVVTHSAFMHWMSTNFAHGGSVPVQTDLMRWYENCEMRTFTLYDHMSMANPPDPLHFPGGSHVGVQ